MYTPRTLGAPRSPYPIKTSYLNLFVCLLPTIKAKKYPRQPSLKVYFAEGLPYMENNYIYDFNLI